MARSRHLWDPRCDPPDRLVRPVRVDSAGVAGPTPAQARGPQWRGASYGWHVPADTDPDLPEQRILEQAVRLGPDGAVTGWAALRMHGATFFDGLEQGGRVRRPVPLNTGTRTVRPGRGFTTSRDCLHTWEIVVRQGVPCTTPLRATFDEMRYARSDRSAVVAADMACAAGLVCLAELGEYASGHVAWQGIERVRRALPLACEDSRSPAETRTRLVWVLDAALPAPLCNRPLFDRDGRLIGYPDLLDATAGVVGEYDGADHRDDMRHARDVARENEFRGLGLEYFTVTGPDLGRTGLVVDRMHAARSRARFEPAATRLWTLQPPPGWVDHFRPCRHVCPPPVGPSRGPRHR